MKKRVFTAAFLAVLFLVGSVRAYACPSPGMSFSIWSADENYVFRFHQLNHHPHPLHRGTAIAAVHRAGQPPELIYIVEGLYCSLQPHQIFLSNDMRHFALAHPSAPPFVAVVWFYSYGELVSRYYIHDLVEFQAELPDTTWWASTREFFPQYNILAITIRIRGTGEFGILLVDDIQFLFDITTGARLEHDALPEGAVPSEPLRRETIDGWTLHVTRNSRIRTASRIVAVISQLVT